jgi:hypothetical protein
MGTEMERRVGDGVVEASVSTGSARRIAVGAPDGARATLILSGGGVRLELASDEEPLSTVSLGIVVDGVDLSSDSTLLTTRQEVVEDTWTAPSGKSTGPISFRHHATEVVLKHATGLEWQLNVRASVDGVAFRYALDRLEGLAWLERDCTVLGLPDGSRAWVQDYQTWYETPRRGVDLGALGPGEYGLPFLARLGSESDGSHLLLTESGIDGRFSGAHAVINGRGRLGLALAETRTEVARGPVTPWRVLLIGGLAQIVESRFVDELAPPPGSELEDATWVRPGRAAWSWWSDFYSGAQIERQRHFVDRAADLGWEHLLIDCGWEETWVPEIVAYASRRGIQVHLWTVWHDLDGPGKLARLALWRSWGVAGIKVDFMESESKDRYRWYDAVLAETARLGLMVNFHGSVIPRGWVRTWPHVVGYEAVRGSEYYVFYSGEPLTAQHNVALPFSRNVVGAMDFTPVALSAPGRMTSDGHEVAQAIVFECGVTHFADDVDVYARSPHVRRLLSELPASWDETLLLAGSPDREAVIARRSGDRWFVGAIASGPARRVRVSLDRLAKPRWQAWVVRDDLGGGLCSDEGSVDGELVVDIASNGGFAAVLAPPGAPVLRAVPSPVLDAPTVEPTRTELGPDGSAVLTVSQSALLRTPPGWSAQALGAGQWRVTGPRRRRPGQLGVVTVEEPGVRGVPNVAHARLTVPLAPGHYVLSDLPMLNFRNESGPVERNMSNGGGNPSDGAPMRIGAVPVADGFGVSTPSEVVLALDARVTRLTVDVGVDDETACAHAVAEVWGDGTLLARADLSGGATATTLAVDVRGVRTLALRTRLPSPEAVPAHVDWGNGRLLVADEDLHTNHHAGR